MNENEKPGIPADELAGIQERLSAVQCDPWRYEPNPEVYK
jgi:hypothetical protein